MKFKREAFQSAVRSRIFTPENSWRATGQVRFGENVECFKSLTKSFT